MRVVWSPLAEQRAARIVALMRRTNAGAAWRWSQAMLARVRALSKGALRGFGVPELDHRARIGEITIAPYRVIYRVDPRRVVILTFRAARTFRSARQPPHDRERDGDHHGQ